MGVSYWPPGRWVSLWACLVVWLLAQCGAQQVPAPCSMGPAPRDLNGSQYQPGSNPDGGTTFLSAFVQSFLGTVQPNPFPEELLLEVAKYVDGIIDRDTVKKSELCPAEMMRGHMYQEQNKSTNCRRRGIYWGTVLLTAIILAGNICMFRSNQSLAFSLGRSMTQSHSTLDNLQTYLTAVPREVHTVVRNRLNDIGRLLGEKLQEALGGPVNPALDSVRKMSQEVKSTSQLLDQVNATLRELRLELDTTQANLTAVRDRVNGTFRKPTCLGCAQFQEELRTLSLDTSFTVPHLSEFQSAVDEVVDADLDSRLKEGEEYMDSLPQRVTNETRSTVESVKQQLEDIKAQISQVTNDIPLSTLTEVSVKLQEVQGYIDEYSPEVEKAERYSWIVGLILSCVVLLVVVCNILGLLLGPVGLEPKADPTHRSGTAHCGGTFLMAGVGFSFLFSWLFMILVLLLFLLGGNVYTLVCEPWQSGEFLQIIDTSGLIPGFQLSESLGLKTNLTISDVYEDCQRDSSLWTTLHLQEIINLDDLLNVSKYTDEIQQIFDQNDITLPTFTLLSPETRAQLQKFSNMATDVDLSSTTEQLNNISRTDLNSTANKLDDLAALQVDPTVRSELREEATQVRRIQAQIEGSVLPRVGDLNSTIQLLEAQASTANGTVNAVLRTVGAAQDFLNHNTSQIVKSESQKFLDCQMKYFTAYADWAKRMITQQVGRCGPVAAAVDDVEVVVCSYVTESLNAFWFSLGWCLIFLIPNIILSVKLAKFYRKMKHTDVFENHIQMNHFPQANLKPY
ncbi:hypothetical protein AAFF_G00138190 [Aldrovandia affinis]|uniref:Prominin-1-A-like n=1 Tax=Aldrovandia affinis TaxID=143900 RepID=A0AAD7X2P9_9TELE|nr:hypothetical protein AAFF_G00138190 [Aldrovandia affinis]